MRDLAVLLNGEDLISESLVLGVDEGHVSLDFDIDHVLDVSQQKIVEGLAVVEDRIVDFEAKLGVDVSFELLNGDSKAVLLEDVGDDISELDQIVIQIAQSLSEADVVVAGIRSSKIS